MSNGRKRQDFSYLVGQKFGNIIVLEELPRKPYIQKTGYTKYITQFKVKCSCGNEYILNHTNILSKGNKCECPFIDNLINKRFGRGIVISKLPLSETIYKSGRIKKTQNWELKCDCGNLYITDTQSLIRPTKGTISCGCSRRLDIEGQKFGKLTAIKYDGLKSVGKQGRTKHTWLCKCDCGNESIVYTDALVSGRTKSCGCYQTFKQSIYVNPNFVGHFNEYFLGLKEGAKRRSTPLSFNITKEDILSKLNLQQNKCALSGLQISFNNGSASVDRINSNLGYSLFNIQIVHKTINFMKSVLTNEEFISFCSSVCDYNRRE